MNLTKLLNSIAMTTHFMLNGEGGVPTLARDADASFLTKVWKFLLAAIGNSFAFVQTILVKVCTIVGRLILNIVDFLFILSRQIMGINANYDSLDSIGDDMILKFIFNPTVINIVKQMIIIGIVLIIVFSIIAILRAEYGNVSGADTSKKRILVNALKSCFLMLIVPVICVLSLVFSNAVLSSVYRVTSGGSDISVATHIWKASTYQANAYRYYADQDLKIPITYNFKNINDDGSALNFDTINEDGTISDLENALIEYKNQSSFWKGFSTWYMFNTREYVGMSDIDRTEAILSSQQKHSAYYEVYDGNLYFKRVEYYVMADAIDHCLDINNVVENGFFFMSINDIYLNHCQVYGVDTVTDLPITYSAGEGGYKTSVWYDGETQPTQYFSPENTDDESNGTVYALCYSEKIKIPGSDVETEIVWPFIQNDKYGFNSDYVKGAGSLVIARGLFDDSGHPTAIRRGSDGDIQFYRNDIFAPTLLDFIPRISYELPEGQHEHIYSWFLRKGIEVVTGIDTDELIPKMYVNFNIFTVFTNSEKNVAEINGNTFKVDYNMSDPSLSTANLYAEHEINPFVLLIGSVILLEVLFFVAFGLLGRVLDCVVLAITYPGVVSAMPLDSGGMLSQWVETFINKLVCVYGIVVVLNFSLLIMPVVWGIEFFTPTDIANIMSKTIGIESMGWTSRYINQLISLLFTLVGFSLIKKFTVYMNFMLSTMTLDEAKKKYKAAKKKDPSIGDFEDWLESIDEGIATTGDTLWKETKSVVETTAAIVSGKFLMNTLSNAKGRLADYIPGAPIKTVVKDIRSGIANRDSMRANANTRRTFTNSLSGSGTSDISTLRNNTDALNDRTRNFRNGRI